MFFQLGIIDSAIILMSLLIIFLIGLYYSKNIDKSKTDYFLAGRNLNWFTIGMSIFAANISSEHFIGLAGSGAQRGFAVAQFELIAIFLLVFLGWVIAPTYHKLNIFTTPEFLGKKFGKETQQLFSGISIFSYVITKIMVTLLAGGLLFQKLFGISIFASASVIVLITGLYTIAGGFNAVVRTQVFQGILLFLGALMLSVLTFNEVGGSANLISKLSSEYFVMFKPISDPDFPWTGILFGAPIIAFWYWCTDQYMVQHVLAAKNINEARTGTLFTAFLKIFPMFILVFPGVAAAALYPDVKGDDAYSALLMGDILPVGLKGLVIASVLAAIMSSLSNAFTSISTLYTFDFYSQRNPNATNRTLIFVSRMTTIFIVIMVILVIPFIKLINNQIYIFLQSIQAFIAPPIAAIFLIGVTLKNISFKSIYFTLIIGESIGISRLILEVLVNSGITIPRVFMSFVEINYLHFTIFSFIGASFLLIILKYIFVFAKNEGFVSGRDLIGKGKITITKLNGNILLSGIILIITIGIWSLFL